MSTSLQIKIISLLGYIVLSTALVVWADDGAPPVPCVCSMAAQK
ncbi:hypothetical protein [Rugamonas sp.]|nr:hypothetical protein [Rugamonas sp.]